MTKKWQFAEKLLYSHLGNWCEQTVDIQLHAFSFGLEKSVEEKTTTKLLDRMETTWEYYNFRKKELLLLVQSKNPKHH